jgi:ubiquinone biosynthesis protein
LSPELDLWTTAAPQVEKWLKKQVGIKAFLRRVHHNLPLWSEQLPALPTLIHDILHNTKEQQEKARFTQTIACPTKNRCPGKKLGYRYFLYGVGTTLLIAGILYFIAK